MKIARIIGIVLIIVGIAMVATGEFNFKSKEKILDTREVEINRTETKIITWPRFTGAIIGVAGIIILLLADKKKKVT
jgi:uncharacterized membrane protein YidH (DUF202 family)